MSVRIDPDRKSIRYRICGASPCVLDAASPSLAIPSLEEDRKKSVVKLDELVTSGRKKIAHVTVTSSAHPARVWEALLAPRARPVLFEGETGYTKGEETERSGTLVQITPRGDGTSAIAKGTIAEEARICGQESTLADVHTLDGETLEWRPDRAPSLTRTELDAATKIAAMRHEGPLDPPLTKLVIARASSGASAVALTDGDSHTAWREDDGRGAFAIMSAAGDVPIVRFSIAGAPHDFYLVTDSKTYAVTLPEDGGSRPGASYDIALKEPVRTSCVALVVGDSPANGAHAAIAISEIVAYSAFDSKTTTLTEITGALSGSDARADAAAGVLKRLGPSALPPLLSRYDALDARGRARAIDVAASAGTCASTGQIFARGAVDDDDDVARKGAEKLARCGRSATPGIVSALASVDAKRRAKLAALAAMIAPEASLAPLADALSAGTPEQRAAIRGALSRSAKSATKETLRSLVVDKTRAEGVRIDLLRAFGDRLPEFAEDADATLTELLRNEPPSFRTRYLLAEPLAILAKKGDPRAIELLRGLIEQDDDPAVRAHAIQEARGVEALSAVALAKSRDPDARVREAAISSLTPPQLDARAESELALRLMNDPWPFVRLAAEEALANAKPSKEIDDVLAKALQHDTSARVRTQSARALLTRNARAHVSVFRERLADEREDVDVRLASARALGAFCDRASSDHLERFATAMTSGTASDSDFQLGLAALEALGHLRPKDFAKLIARLRSDGVPEAVKNAARAAAEEGACP